MKNDEKCLPDRVVHALNAIPVRRPVVDGIELRIDENVVRALLGDDETDRIIEGAAREHHARKARGGDRHAATR